MPEVSVNKPQALIAFEEKAAEKYNALQPRERALMIGAAIAIVIMAVFMLFNASFKKMEAQTAETENYRKALNYLADNRLSYQADRAKKEAMRQKLIDADSKVVSKLTTMASSLGFDVTVTPKDPHKTSDDSGAEEQEIEVTLKNVEYGKFIEYLVQIHKLETPIYVRHLNMNRTSALSNEDTRMTVSITLMSYRLKEQNAT